VAGLDLRHEDRTIARKTVDLGHGLGFTVIAEGVETAAAWDLLGILGCDQAQGYRLARPGPAAGVPGAAGSIAARLATSRTGGGLGGLTLAGHAQTSTHDGRRDDP